MLGRLRPDAETEPRDRRELNLEDRPGQINEEGRVRAEMVLGTGSRWETRTPPTRRTLEDRRREREGKTQGKETNGGERGVGEAACLQTLAERTEKQQDDQSGENRI